MCIFAQPRKQLHGHADFCRIDASQRVLQEFSRTPSIGPAAPTKALHHPWPANPPPWWAQGAWPVRRVRTWQCFPYYRRLAACTCPPPSSKSTGAATFMPSNLARFKIKSHTQLIVLGRWGPGDAAFDANGNADHDSCRFSTITAPTPPPPAPFAAGNLQSPYQLKRLERVCALVPLSPALRCCASNVCSQVVAAFSKFCRKQLASSA